MLKKLIFPIFVLILSFANYGQNINTKDSKVSFSVSNMGIKTVKGTFSQMKGNVNFSPENLSSANFDVCIDTNTLDTKSKKRDAHLKNEDFFKVETYPTICFKSNEIVKTKLGYNAKGTLTMRGISKTVKIPFTYENNKITGNFTVKRLDYKVGEDVGGFMVGKKVTIQIICVLN